MSPSYTHGDPFFEDGNIMLVTKDPPTAFKVHRGVLRRHSEVFHTMFGLTADDDQVELDGFPMVEMHDLPGELGNLIKALYDGPTFDSFGIGIENFFYTAGILRLATKYFIKPLRASAIRALQKSWSSTLAGHDAMITKAIESPTVHDMTYPYVHPLAVINLAEETHVSVLIPPALYFLSLYPLSALLRADHPKLTFEHPSKPSSEMSPELIQQYVLMYQARIEIILDFVRKVCGERVPSSTCMNSRVCSRGFSRLASQLGRSWQTRTGPLHYMLQGTRQLRDDPLMCGSCRKEFEKDVADLRESTWQQLPEMAGFDLTWEELEAQDLE